MMKAILPKTIFGNYWLVIVVFLFTTLFQEVLAQWESDGAIIRDHISPIDDEIIIPDQGHGALVIWVDGRLGTPAIYGQKVDSAGYQLWEEGGSFIGLTTFSYSEHKATTDGKGGAIIAWDNYRVECSDIYAQRISIDDELMWGETGIAVTDWYGYEWQVSIVSDNNGGAIIAWRGDDQGIGRIVVQHLDSLGNKLYGDGGLALTNQVEAQDGPLLAFASDSIFICTWIDNRTTGPGTGIYAQKFDFEGNILWDIEGIPVAVDPAIFSDQFAISPDLYGGFYCVWEGGGIFLQHIDSNGYRSWVPEGIEVSLGGYNCYSYIITSIDGRAVVCWTNDLENYIACNVVDIFGEQQWPGGYVIIENAVGTHGITASVEEEFEVASLINDVPCKRIQKLTLSGEFLFGEGGIGFGIPYEPGLTSMSMVSDDLGGVIVLTKRYNTGPLRIHRVYRNGHVGGDTATYVDNYGKPCKHELSLINYPNPFNSVTTLNYSSMDRGDIDIFNINGQKVKTFNIEGEKEGKITWDATDERENKVSSGIYFARAKMFNNTVTTKLVFLK